MFKSMHVRVSPAPKLLSPLLRASLISLVGLSACYTELEDAEEYKSLPIDTESVRVPNQAPGSESTSTPNPSSSNTAQPMGSGTGPATTAPSTSNTSAPQSPLSAGCADIVERVLNAEFGCGTSGCHGAGSTLVDLGTAEGASERLVDKNAVYCPDLKYVDTQDPSKSAILEKIKATPSCGGRMPPTGDPLSQADVACVTEWVNALAQGEL